MSFVIVVVAVVVALIVCIAVAVVALIVWVAVVAVLFLRLCMVRKPNILLSLVLKDRQRSESPKRGMGTKAHRASFGDRGKKVLGTDRGCGGRDGASGKRRG
jgi:hypothetical protein